MEETFTLLDSDGEDKIPPSSPGILIKPHITFQFLFVFGSLSKHMKPESLNRQLRDAIKVLYKVY
ncbi:calcium-binding EF-hand protein, putative [Medicago truncatula]|uniref:Calcium-binding EF-hand protein, putative n=1 Tax=Medicago truncatula TaxID=3880 RepID=G7KG79_MEDTR|nr:calcium-binding EF-hand protein, putative [Medicago truncatula]